MSASDVAGAGAAHAEHGRKMDHMYRFQRHIYDATRKYYLLGRDQLIANLAVPPDGTVLEMGCGTGRNLLAVAQAYPRSRIHGIDISAEMLKSTERSIRRYGGGVRISTACADATSFDAGECFGIRQFDRIFFSYTLSMIPDWQSALRRAVDLLAPDGELHVVDFGQCEHLPPPFKALLFAWLRQFGVTPRSELLKTSVLLAADNAKSVSFAPLYRGYAWHLSIKKMSEPQVAA